MDGDGGEFRDRLIQNSVEGAPDPAEAVKSEGADGVQDDRYAWEMTSAPWDADADERRQHFFDSYSRDPGFLALLLQESRWLETICQSMESSWFSRAS